MIKTSRIATQAAYGPARHAWWQRGIVYQVYPRSYVDSNSDGVGDLRGITARLDYLSWLGVDALWLSPIYPSPMKDFGYDVADYTEVDPLFGDLADFDALVDAAHARGLKIILDFVPNHTSDQHPWFQQARRSRGDPRRDWYIWRDPAADGGPPNNWLSCFGGSAWQFDAATGQYYYHAFLAEQPDLNWRNPEVVRAMLDVLRFWLQRGVDGFRVDVLWHLIKDEQFRDNPPNPGWNEDADPYHALVPLYTTDRPEVQQVLRQMRDVLDSFSERVLIGEIYLPVERLVQYYGTNLQGAHLPFNFQLLSAAWDAEHIAKLIAEYERLLPQGAWPNWVLGNHDKPRIASRLGLPQARVAALMLLTLRGTPTLYYGDEIGMRDVPIAPDQVQDPLERNVPGLGLGRDPQRTPMRWDGSATAGFTAGSPWLPLGPDVRNVNVAAQRDDPSSMLTLHRRLIELRGKEAALAVGGIERLNAARGVLSYLRCDGPRRLLVKLNLTPSQTVAALPADANAGVILLSTHLDRDAERVEGTVALRANEGLVIAVR